MKRIMKVTAFAVIVALAAFVLASYVTLSDANSEQSCMVTVRYANGDPADNVTVTAWYNRGTWHDFKTDDYGVVKLTWDGSYITHLFVKGDKYEVDYSDGRSYTLTLVKKNKYD